MSLIEKYDFSYRGLPITTGMIRLAREMSGLCYVADNPNTEVRQIVSKVFQDCYWWYESRRYAAADCFRIASGGGLKKNGEVHITPERLLYELSFILFGNSLGIHFSNIYSCDMGYLTDFLYAYSESKFARNMILQVCKKNGLALPWKCEEYRGKLCIEWVLNQEDLSAQWFVDYRGLFNDMCTHYTTKNHTDVFRLQLDDISQFEGLLIMLNGVEENCHE